MNRRSLVNLCLALACLATTALCRLVPERDVTRPNYDFLPEAQMVKDVAFDSFAPNPNFSDGVTLRSPPAGTIARGRFPLHYQPTPEDAVRAGQELLNPLSEKDSFWLRRGSVVFANFCEVCHGPTGQGNAPTTQRGFPPPPSLLTERAIRMKDGQMFHVQTYGQGRMPPHAAQLSREDRWSAVLHVRVLQRGDASAGQPGLAPVRIEEITRNYRENCAACHGDDGTGNIIRKALPLIPDFTSLAWQTAQTDIAIVNQIDYGSLPLMPAFRYRFTPRQILELAIYVRSFGLRQPAGAAPLPVVAHASAKDVYRTYCFACHDTTGRGNQLIHKMMPELPDFTSPIWEKSRSDADLARSIVEGKGKFMLPMKDKLGTVDVEQMVSLVRGFQDGTQVIEVEGPKLPGPPPPVVAAVPNTLPQGALTQPPPSEQPLAAPSGETAARIRAGAGIFRQYCIICHGPDGTGSIMRVPMPAIPDFTSSVWQQQHADPQLLASILDGKGTLMPANRGRISALQARDLVAYARAFGPKLERAKTKAGETDFDKSFRQLQDQWNELEQQLQKSKAQGPEK